VRCQTLTPQLAAFFEVEQGVLLTDVAEGSAGQAAGLRAGDIILEANGKQTDNVQSFRAATGKTPQSAVLRLLIKRQDSLLFVAMKMP